MQAAIDELISAVYCTPGLDERTTYAAIDVLQEYSDYLEQLADNLPPADFAVTTVMEDTGVKFKTLDAFADFLAKRMNA